MNKKLSEELGVQVNLASDHLSPERTISFYNPKMYKNRMLVLCAMKAAVKERTQKGTEKRMKCLDAFGATGIMGLQWMKHNPDNISVTISDTNPASVDNIRRNCALNDVFVSDSKMPHSESERLEMRESTAKKYEDCTHDKVSDVSSVTERTRNNGDQIQLRNKSNCGKNESVVHSRTERTPSSSDHVGIRDKSDCEISESGRVRNERYAQQDDEMTEEENPKIAVQETDARGDLEPERGGSIRMTGNAELVVEMMEEERVGTETNYPLPRLEEKVKELQQKQSFPQSPADADQKNRESVTCKNRQRVNVLCLDAHLVMRQRFFDFIHLDPYGCATPFMDSAFSNVGNHGIVSITSTDTSALYGKCPQVTLRNYGGRVAKCEYLRELAARLIIASAVRAAARCNKGVEPLLCVALEHFVLVILRVRRGAGHADRSVGMVKHLIHCQMCGQRSFVSNTLSVPSSLYQFLDCSCQQKAPGKTAVLLGPVWSGDIYDADFVDGMEQAGKVLGLGKKDLHLLSSLQDEAVCSGDSKAGDAGSNPKDETDASCTRDGCSFVEVPPEKQLPKRTNSAVDGASCVESVPKRRCKEESLDGHPAFYFSIPRHSVKDMDSPKINKLIECLHQKGFRASRTHFDPEGVRTNAGLADFQAVLKANSTPTKK